MLPEEGFLYELVVLRVPVLDEGPLHRLLMRISRHIDLLHRERVEAGVVHGRRNGAWGRVEILHLLRDIAHITDVLRELDRILQCGARVTGHEVRYDILSESELVVDLLKFLHEAVVDLDLRLAHLLQYPVRDVLWCHTHLSRDVILADLAEELLIRIRHEVIEAEAGSDKDLLHPRQRTHFAEQLHIVAVIDLQVLTRLWPETFATDTGALRELLLAGWSTELGGRTTDIEDVALEFLILRDLLRLREDAFVGAALHDTSLMHGEGAEIALAEAAAALGDAFLDLTEGRDAACRIVHRMPCTHERKRVDIIHLHL